MRKKAENDIKIMEIRLRDREHRVKAMDIRKREIENIIREHRKMKRVEEKKERVRQMIREQPILMPEEPQSSFFGLTQIEQVEEVRMGTS